MRFGLPTSSFPSGVTVAALRPRPCSRIARAASWTTSFRGRPPLLEREVEAGKLELEADDIRGEDAQRLLEQLLPGLVPLEDHDRPLGHSARV